MANTRMLLGRLRDRELSAANGVPDADLLTRFLDHRDEAAFALLLARHGPMVWGVCSRALGNEADAEDAFQATFVVLVRKARSISPPSRVGNWLYGVACCSVRKALACGARGREVTTHPFPDPPAPERCGAADLADWVDVELQRVPEKYRTPVVLCELQGLTLQEAAHTLGCPVGTVASRLARGRKALAERLARSGRPFAAGVLAAALAHNLGASDLSARLHVLGRAALNPTTTTTGAAALSNGVFTTMLFQKLRVAVLGLAVPIALGLVCAAVSLAGGQPPRPAEDNAPKKAAPPENTTPTEPKNGPGEAPKPAAPAPKGRGIDLAKFVDMQDPGVLEMGKFQGLWRDPRAGMVHKDGVEEVQKPGGGLHLFIQGNRVVWLDEDGRPNGNEDVITLEVNREPKRIVLEHVRIGGAICTMTPKYGIYRETDAGMEVHFRLSDGTDGGKYQEEGAVKFALKGPPPPSRFLEAGKPVKGLDGATWTLNRIKLGAAAKPDKNDPPLIQKFAMPVYRPTLPTGDWSGTIIDPKLRAAAPENNHLITDDTTWKAVWKAWGKGEALPEVDFKTEVLLVFTALGPNVPSVNLYEGNGSVTAHVGRTVLGGPGFGYRIVKIPRKGIHSVLGQSID